MVGIRHAKNTEALPEKKTCPNAALFPHKSHMNWSGNEPRPQLS